MVNLTKYTKEAIVKMVQYKKDKSTLKTTPANMRMSKKALVDLWSNRLTEVDIKKHKPRTQGRAGRPPNPKPISRTTISTQTTTTENKKKRTKTSKKAPNNQKGQKAITTFFTKK